MALSDSTPPSPTTGPTVDPKRDCSTCRHHAKRVEEEFIQFENEFNQMRTTDVNVFICQNQKSPTYGKGVKEPIEGCGAFEAPVKRGVDPELAARMDAALIRFKRPDPDR